MVSATMREQLQRVTDKKGTLLLALLEHPAMDPVRLVNDTRNWEISGQTWIGLPFRFQLPQDVQGQAGRASLEVDNVGRGLTPLLESLPVGAALQCTLRLVSRGAPTIVEYEFTAPLSGVSAAVAVVQATMGNDDVLRGPAVKVRHDPTLAPGLFAG